MKHTHAGFSLIEVVLSIALIAMFASSLFVYLGTQLISSMESRRSLNALELSREGLEASRAIRDSGWSNLSVGTHGLDFTNGVWSFQNASDTSDIFNRTIDMTDLSATERQVISTVSWRPTPGQTRTISLTTNVSNWRIITAGPGGGPMLSGNWANPQTLGTIDLGAGIQATGIAVRNKLIYMTGIASNSGKADFFVVNTTDGQHPSIAASLNTGPGLNAVAVSGTFAYAASDDSSSQLQILNISATTTPIVIDNMHLAGNNEDGLSIAATGTLALVGTEQDSGPEFYLVDVVDPAVPVIKSSLEIGANVNRIVVYGNHAFIGTTSSTNEFMIVDISNPNVPIFTNKINLTGTNAITGLYINPQDDRAYITRNQAAGTSPEILVYDVSNPASPSLLGSTEFGYNIPAVFAADSLVFLGANQSNLEFQIFDSTDPTTLTYYGGVNFPQYVNDMAFENNILYVALRSNDALRIITSQ